MKCQFINTGIDERIVKSIDKSKLVPVQVQVRGKHGTYTAVRFKSNEKPKGNKPKLLNKDYAYLDNQGNVFSSSEVVQEFNNLSKKEQQKYKTIDDYLKSNYFISTGNNTTADTYRVSIGKYKTSRFNKVHKPIIQEYIDKAPLPPSDVKPICFLFGGGSASGKTTVAKSIAEPIMNDNGMTLVTVDCDEIKSKIPEFELMDAEDSDTSVFRVHRESSDITNEIIDSLIENGKCFAYDGCMGDYDKYSSIIDKLREKNYDVHVIGVDIPTDLAVERASKRERKVFEPIIRKAHKDFSENFLEVAALADSFVLLDNSQENGKPNKVILDTEGIQDDDLYERFLTKAGVL